MTDLSCKATKCGYNKEEKCSKGEIRVGGEQAKECMETRCEDFDSKRKQSCESCATPKNQIEIACEATKCQYNEKDHCTAKHVDIQGIDANMSRETDCSTFKAAKAS